MALGNRGRSAIQTGVDTFGPFKVGNVNGTNARYLNPGRLPEPYRTEFLNAQRDNLIRYVVRSYATPIAWLLVEPADYRASTGVWVIPDVKYSATTTNHQTVVRVATGHAGHYVERPTRRTYGDIGATLAREVSGRYDATGRRDDIVADIDATLADVAAAGWTNPFSDPHSPTRALAG